MPTQGLVWATGLVRFAAVFAAYFAFVFAALDTGLAFVGAAFFAGITSVCSASKCGKGEDREECFHDF